MKTFSSPSHEFTSSYPLIAFLFSGVLLRAPVPPAGQNLPNVIVVITDDQGYGDLGGHGNDALKTPNLDRFFEELWKRMICI